ncbi:MAG: FHA domain-containing protein, partial [Verrucomicrobiota bacterium]
MKAILQIDSGPYAGKMIRLRAARTWLGSTNQADLTIVGDPDMSATHFSLDLEEASVTARDLDSGTGTEVNGELIESRRLDNGDRIRAGSTMFTVLIEREPSDPEPPPPEPEPAFQMPEEEPVLTAASICSDLELDIESADLLDQQVEPEDYVDRLAGQELYKDAVRVLARWMSKRAAVWWCYQCVQKTYNGDIPDEEASALATARKWVVKPSEEVAQMAQWVAERAGNAGPGSWTALAVFFSGESLAPPNMPAVAPEARLTSSGVVNALILAAYYGDPGQSVERFNQYIE